jgi:hypothetical protein
MSYLKRVELNSDKEKFALTINIVHMADGTNVLGDSN